MTGSEIFEIWGEAVRLRKVMGGIKEALLAV